DFGLLIGLNGLLVLVLELPTTCAVSRYRPEYVLAIGNLLIGVGLALTGFMTGMVLLSATVLMWTFGEMMSSSVANAYLGSLAPPRMVGRYQGLYGAAYTIGTGAGPVIGGAVYAIRPWALWARVGAAGLLPAQLCRPRRRAVSTADEPDSCPGGGTVDDTNVPCPGLPMAALNSIPCPVQEIRQVFGPPRCV